jgi:hypothetical protein
LLDRARGRELTNNETLGPLFAELEEVRDRLTAALEQRRAATSALVQTRVADMLAREDFCAAYSREAGLIRSIFPRDAERRELFFDSWTRSANRDEEAAPADEPEGGATPPVA